MTNKELARKKELCSTLDLNFDEANELFSSETLDNMKMSQISGGHTGGQYCYQDIQIAAISAGTNFMVFVVNDPKGGVCRGNSTGVDNGDGTLTFKISYEMEVCGGYRQLGTTFTIEKHEFVEGYSFQIATCTPAPTSTPGM